MITLETIKKFCKDLKLSTSEVNVEVDDDIVKISLRDYPDDEPTQRTYTEARKAIASLKEKFGTEVKIGSEVIDEWIDINISLVNAKNVEVEVLKYPISDRYCSVGETGTLDPKTSQIRVGGAWFSFDERWEVKLKP